MQTFFPKTDRSTNNKNVAVHDRLSQTIQNTVFSFKNCCVTKETAIIFCRLKKEQLFYIYAQPAKSVRVSILTTIMKQ